MTQVYSHFYKHLVAGLFFLLAPYYAIGQQGTQTVRGVVVDNITEMPLIGAYVQVVGETGKYEAIADLNGEFTIKEVPIGRHDIMSEYLGYEDFVLPEILITTGKELVLTLRLSESVSKMDEIVISGGADDPSEPVNNLAVVSSRSITVEQSERFAASVNDPARLVLSFAGVRGADDILNAISVRGNNPYGVLWRVEGLEVPSPNHFSLQGGAGGSVSMISNNLLKTSDFFTGAFPAEYGNALSGVFDLRLRKGNNQKREYAIQVGIMGLQASAEGPFTKNKKASYLISYRYSTLGLLDKMGYQLGNAVTSYQDVNFKIHVPTQRAGKFSFYGVGGISEIHLPAESNKGKETTKDYDMAVVGMTHQYSLNKRNLLTTNAAFSASRETWEKDKIGSNGKLQPKKRFYSGYKSYRIASTLNTKFSGKSSLRSGVIATAHLFNLTETENIRKYGIEFGFKARDNTYTLQGFSQWKYRITSDLTFSAGLHAFYFGYNKDYSIEPRVALQYNLNSRHQFSLGSGLHSRLEPLAVYMATLVLPTAEFQLNRELELTKSIHIVGGYKVQLTERLSLKAEVYYQHLYDLPVDIDSSSIFSTANFIGRYVEAVMVNEGIGRNYGIELTLERQFNNGYYLLMNTSLFQSKYKPLDGIWRNTAYNANHIFNTTAGKEINVGKEGNNILGFHSRFVWAGGYWLEDENFEERLSDYFRLDARISYKRIKARYSWELSVDIQNVTNRKNEILFDILQPSGLIPVAQYKVEF